MNELREPDAVWDHIAPHLDAALSELSEADRDAVLLRYFERQSAREMAQTLGTSEETAQKRVSRAVVRLRECLAKRGVTIGASGLVVAIAATSTTVAAKAIAMTTLQRSIIGTALAAAVGTAVYEARQVSLLREHVQAIEQPQARWPIRSSN